MVIAGGGTAGHVYPGLAVGAGPAGPRTRRRLPRHRRGLEATLVPAAGFPFHAAPPRRSVGPGPLGAEGARGRRSGRGRVPAGGGHRRRRPRDGRVRERADRAGRPPGAGPGGRPRAECEAGPGQPRPGPAGRARRRVVPRGPGCLRAPRSAPGRPHREPGSGGDPSRARRRDRRAKEARAELDLDEDRTTVLVFGGSQGALSVNRAAAGASLSSPTAGTSRWSSSPGPRTSRRSPGAFPPSCRGGQSLPPPPRDRARRRRRPVRTARRRAACWPGRWPTSSAWTSGTRWPTSSCHGPERPPSPSSRCAAFRPSSSRTRTRRATISRPTPKPFAGRVGRRSLPTRPGRRDPCRTTWPASRSPRAAGLHGDRSRGRRPGPADAVADLVAEVAR